MKRGAFLFVAKFMGALDPIVEYSQRLGMEFGLKIAINEYKSLLGDKSIVLSKAEAEKQFSADIITSLVKRGLLQDYQFGVDETEDEDGNLIKKPKGRIYYRRIDILEAMEKGNVLKGLAELRAKSYRLRENTERVKKHNS